MISDKFSVIVPSFNSARYLKDLVASIYGGESSLGTLPPQTVLPLDLVICDDGSTDNTEEVVQNLQKEYDRISYIKLSGNFGTPKACNEAIKYSSTEFITRIDADDMREPQSFEKLLQVQLENRHSMIYDDVRIFLKGKKQSATWKMNEYDFDKLLEENFIHAGIMFPKVAWEEVGGYPEEFIHGRDDWSFNVSLGIFGYCGIHVSYAGYLYRREQQNRTLRTKSSEWNARFKSMMTHRFKDIYDGRRPMGCCGNRSKNVSSQPVSRVSGSQPIVGGSEGMTTLEYMGGNYGSEFYYGPVTGTAYRFSVTKKLRNVDNRDLHSSRGTGLLDLHVGSHSLFRIYSRESAPDPVEVHEPEPELEVRSESYLTADIDDVQFSTTVSSSSEVSEKIDSSSEGTIIEVGQASHVGPQFVRKVKDAGITTWEQFLTHSVDELRSITGMSVEKLQTIIREITE